ncbi:MAG TPA: GrpB family protein [Thermoanaerobaculia bacterium]|nr:GrpB family protein [Thermoanaerobaculia bacterium]
MSRRRPNFFLAGAPRCGTTSMYAYLKQHPEIWVSVDKEPHFFGSDLTPQPGTIREEELYLALFAGAGDRPRAGEGSVWYLSSRKAPYEIRDYAPGAKIILLLREPAQMAYSLYSLYCRTGNEDLPTFEGALAAEPERREGRRIPEAAYFPEGLLYTGAARSAEKVERYFEVFGRENVHCILFDDFVRDTAAAYRRTLQFLGVDPEFQAELDPGRASQRIRMLAIQQLRQLPPELMRRIQFQKMKLHDAAGPRPPLAGDTAERLRALFAADVTRLGALLGRDLDAWTRGEALAPAQAPRKAPRGDMLASVRALKSFPPELRAKHDKVETLERKLSRWQKIRVPELSLEQRPYSPAWSTWFAGEQARIAAALGPRAVRIEHFGSTSVPGLSSKNIVDVAVGLEGPPDAEAEGALAGLGYESYGNSPVDPETLWFWKLSDDRAFVLHVCDHHRPWIGEQADMREYLRAHPEERDRYAERKRRLAEEKGQGLLHYSLRKLALTVDMVDRAQTWRAAAGLATEPTP